MNRILLTPGPLTTAGSVREAMLRDWGSRDREFVALCRDIAVRLADMAHAADTHDAVLLQGSGTFAIEAAIGSLVGSNDRLLVLVNGAYGRRMVEIAERLNLNVTTLSWPDTQPVDPLAVESCLADDRSITHVAFVHCETTTGIMNPLAPLARLTAENGCQLILDAMSSFGAMPLDLRKTRAAAVVAASGKCLESVPGAGFVLVDREVLGRIAHRAPSLALDLGNQWRSFRQSGQWRFTPPVQVIAALGEALHLLTHEGGPSARLRRYRRNLSILTEGLAAEGLEPIIKSEWQAPVIVTFPLPSDLVGGFDALYDGLRSRGFLIYPGKLTERETFRVGCIGAFPSERMSEFVTAFKQVVSGLSVLSSGPLKP